MKKQINQIVARTAEWVARRRNHERWRFTWDTLILFIGNGITSFLFLLFHMLAGRKMAGEAYAEFVAMIGLLNVLTVPAGVMQLTMARHIAERDQKSTAEAWLLLVRRGLSGVTRWGLLALCVWCAVSPWLRSGLRASSSANVVMVGVIAFVFLYTPILGGALQGSRRFGWFVSSGIGVAVSRLLLVIPVLWMGGGVATVLGVVAASYIMGLIVSYWPLRGIEPAESPDRLPSSGAVHRYFWGVLIGQLALFVLIQADLILSPRLFQGETLAAYGKAATLSRIVFFLPLPIITAMFPRAVTSANPRILFAPLLATLLVTLAAAAVLTLFPVLPMRFMYGVCDPIHVELIRRYVWAAIPLALISILSPYLWARQGGWPTLWIIPVMLAYVLALLVGSVTPQQVILYLFVAGAAAFVVLLAITPRLLRAGSKGDGSCAAPVSGP